MNIKKDYPLHTLTDDPDYINWRIGAIEKFTKGMVSFVRNKDKITRITKKIQGDKAKVLTQEHLEQLAEQLDLAHKNGLVHGDIHPKNILISNGRAVLIDWEPSLKQLIGNINTLMFTAPWIAPEDQNKKQLSIKTDLICFYHLKQQQKFSFFLSERWENLQKMAFYSKIPFTTLLTIDKEKPHVRRKQTL